ncbi:GNAT family N-acetyltransferase [Legionella tucsonensis]|uniref:Acetyltransferase n=1 Tax=Legionella tucsonensis TaxID=40335 RepID=A0A0W0ZQY8_9GAMM|nr:GNAT family N-acetyltransferase [Legionella tucsonensis]KTD71219.1 acetyltransferase [Legionella tucsonensis]
MTKYKFELTEKNEDILISAKERTTGIRYGYVQISSSITLENKKLIEIAQIFVNQNIRGSGLGSELASRAIEYVLKKNKGIHMMIQPGSVGFWRKYFNNRFDGRRMTLFGGEVLNSKLSDGVVFEISMISLIKNYKFPMDKDLRAPGIERICQQVSQNILTKQF